jgi:uncharacterized protein with von Willebrand factor type A (vWA) domain/WD40 repeat protein
MNDREQPLPLLELFNRLRKAGLPLGIDEYNLVLQAMQHGFGIADQEALARLCRTLWVKSGEEKLLFNYHFQQVMDEWTAQARSIQSENNPILETRENRNLFSVLKSKRFWIFGVFLLLLIIDGFISHDSSGDKQCPYFTSTPPTSVIKGQKYSYIPVVCKAHETDPPPKISVSNQPSWLRVKSNHSATVKLEGTPKSNLFVWHPIIRRWDLTGRQQGNGVIIYGSDVEYSRVKDKNFKYDDLKFPKISPDGEYFLTQQYVGKLIDGKYTDQKQNNLIINTWNSSRENLITIVHSHEVKKVVFSPNSEFLATVQDDGLIQIWDRRGKFKYKKNYLTDDMIDNVQVSSDGRQLVIASRFGEVSTWHLPSNNIPDISEYPSSKLTYYYGLDFSNLSSNGKYIAVKKDDSTIVLWNILEKKLVALKHNGIVAKAVFSPDSEFLATAAGDGLVRIWDLRGKVEQRPMYRIFHKEKVSDVKLSVDRKHIVALTEDKVYLWDFPGQHKISLPESQVIDMNFSPNGQFLTTRSKDNIVKLWDVDGQRDKSRLTLDGKNYAIMFSSNGQSIISTSLIDYSTINLQVKDSTGHVKDTQSFNLQVSPTLWEMIKIEKGASVVLGFIFSLLLLTIAYPIARWWLTRNAEFSTEEEPSMEPIDSLSPPKGLESQPEPEDEVQVGKAILADRIETSEYFPVTGRQMKQSWRYLRRMIREGSPTELDLEETVKQISKQGLLLNLVLRPRRVNRSELLLLIDQEGSMVPFHALSRRLVDTALQGGRLARVGIYHFHNCPDEYLYNDPRRTEAMAINAILNTYTDSTGVLIFSDAGAAHGGISPERIRLTEEFLARLKQRFRYVAWLNPMPVDRWQGTSAESIARLVPMFEFTRQGLHEAIAVLRGKLVPLSIETDGDPVQNVRSTY